MPPRTPKPPKPPKAKESWDIRDPSPQGDLDPKILFEQIGRALTEWESVEARCAELFAVFTLSPSRNPHFAPAIRAYGSVNSYQGRCDMIRAAAAAYFQTRPKKQKQFEKEVEGVMKDCLLYSNRRNELAHGRVLKFREYTNKRKTKSRDAGYYTFPSLFNPKKYKLDQTITYRYMSSDAIHYRQEFTKLHLRLYALRRRLLSSMHLTWPETPA